MAVSQIDPLKMNKFDVLNPCQNAVFHLYSIQDLIYLPLRKQALFYYLRANFRVWHCGNKADDGILAGDCLLRLSAEFNSKYS